MSYPFRKNITFFVLYGIASAGAQQQATCGEIKALYIGDGGASGCCNATHTKQIDVASIMPPPPPPPTDGYNTGSVDWNTGETLPVELRTAKLPACYAGNNTLDGNGTPDHDQMGLYAGSIVVPFGEHIANGIRTPNIGFHDKIVFMETFASWCIPCFWMAPKLYNYARNNPFPNKVIFAALSKDTDLDHSVKSESNTGPRLCHSWGDPSFVNKVRKPGSVPMDENEMFAGVILNADFLLPDLDVVKTIGLSLPTAIVYDASSLEILAKIRGAPAIVERNNLFTPEFLQLLIDRQAGGVTSIAFVQSPLAGDGLHPIKYARQQYLVERNAAYVQVPWAFLYGDGRLTIHRAIEDTAGEFAIRMPSVTFTSPDTGGSLVYTKELTPPQMCNFYGGDSYYNISVTHVKVALHEAGSLDKARVSVKFEGNPSPEMIAAFAARDRDAIVEGVAGTWVGLMSFATTEDNLPKAPEQPMHHIYYTAPDSYPAECSWTLTCSQPNSNGTFTEHFTLADVAPTEATTLYTIFIAPSRVKAGDTCTWVGKDSYGDGWQGLTVNVFGRLFTLSGELDEYVETFTLGSDFLPPRTIGELIAEAVGKVGKEGVITVEEAKG